MTKYGITPACAGKRIHYNRRFLVNWDHPRMCGEKRVAVSNGKDRILNHPRMCGEKFIDKVYEEVRKGSPPHVRGKVFPPDMCNER